MSCACEQTAPVACGCLKITIGNCMANFDVCSHNGREVQWVDLAEFLPRVRLVARGVPDDVALEFINAAAVRFARTTGVLKRRAVVDIQAEVQDYFVQAGEHEQIYRMDTVQQCGDVQWQFQPPDKIWLEKMPCADVPRGLLFEYTALPVQAACAVDKLLFDYYQDGIVAGALAELLLMRQYDFADPQMAVVYEQKYKLAVNAAMIDLAKGFDNRQMFVAGKGLRI